MKLHGQSLLPTRLTTPVVLPRPHGESIVLQLQPLPLSFHRRLRERGLLPPAPPVRIARDSQGRPQRDPQGQVITHPDHHAPEYLCELEKYHQRLALLAVAESLTADPALQLETAPPSATANDSASAAEWCRYADQLAEEFERAGFSAGDLLKLCEVIRRLSNLADEQLATHYANFCGATPADST